MSDEHGNTHNCCEELAEFKAIFGRSDVTPAEARAAYQELANSDGELGRLRAENINLREEAEVAVQLMKPRSCFGWWTGEGGWSRYRELVETRESEPYKKEYFYCVECGLESHIDHPRSCEVTTGWVCSEKCWVRYVYREDISYKDDEGECVNCSYLAVHLEEAWRMTNRMRAFLRENVLNKAGFKLPDDLRFDE